MSCLRLKIILLATLSSIAPLSLAEANPFDKTRLLKVKIELPAADWKAMRYEHHDLFGLKTQGRTESILMSLPPHVQWHYQFEAQTKAEKQLLDVVSQPFLLHADCH